MRNSSKKQDTRRIIIEAAERLFSQVDFQKTTLADIAHELRMSLADVFRLFPTRAKINEAVGRCLLSEVEAAVDGSLILNDWFLVLHAVLDGLGIGYFPEILVSSHVANGRLTRVMEDWCGRLTGVFLFYPSRRQVPGPLRAFIDFMHEHNTISAPPRTE